MSLVHGNVGFMLTDDSVLGLIILGHSSVFLKASRRFLSTIQRFGKHLESLGTESQTSDYLKGPVLRWTFLWPPPNRSTSRHSPPSAPDELEPAKSVLDKQSQEQFSHRRDPGYWRGWDHHQKEINPRVIHEYVSFLRAPRTPFFPAS